MFQVETSTDRRNWEVQPSLFVKDRQAVAAANGLSRTLMTNTRIVPAHSFTETELRRVIAADKAAREASFARTWAGR